MSSSVVVGKYEVSSNHESAADMVKALAPAKEGSKEPRITVDGGKPVEQDDEGKAKVSEAARELGKKGGEATAKARADKASDKAEPETAAKSKEDKDEVADKDDDKPSGKPRHDPEARVKQATDQLAAERRRNQALEERIAKLEAAGRRPEAPEKPAAAAKGKPKVEDFETYEDYTEALTEWKLDERQGKQAEAEKQAQRQAAQEGQTRAWREAQDACSERINQDPELVKRIDPDLAKAIEYTKPGQMPTRLTALGDEILKSPIPAELLVYFTEHDGELKRVYEAPDVREMARMIAKIEAKLEENGLPPAKAEPEQPKPERKVSSAPPPMKPLAPSAAVVGGEDIMGDIDLDTYRRLSRKQRG